MKHAHNDIIKQWLEDITQRIELFNNNEDWIDRDYYHLFMDTAGLYKFRIKPKPDQYQHFTLTSDIEFNENNIRVKLIKSGIDGKISAEVIQQ